MSNCLKAQAVADWVYWTQKSPAASASAVRCVARLLPFGATPRVLTKSLASSRNWVVVPNQATRGDADLTQFLSQVRIFIVCRVRINGKMGGVFTDWMGGGGVRSSAAARW